MYQSPYIGSYASIYDALAAVAPQNAVALGVTEALEPATHRTNIYMP